MATRKKNPKNPPRKLAPAAKMAPPKKAGPKPTRIKTAPAGGNQTRGAKKKKKR